MSRRIKYLLLWAVLAIIVIHKANAEEEDRVEAEVEEDEEAQFGLDQLETRNLHPRAYQQNAYLQNNLPSGFRPSGPEESRQEEEQYVQPQHQAYAPQPSPPPRAAHRKEPRKQQQQQQQQQQLQQLVEELEEEKEEPDRLSQLLQSSKFQCGDRSTGYYADEELQCEVFHYCQDNVKHSWICPEGFTFHQVHLICMPPSGDNICQKSSKYHFVNDYLYKPLNAEEAQRKPNVTLRYSDRYYPAEVYHDDRYDDEEEQEEQEPEPPRRHPARLQAQPQQQVFRSPEEVNIPLIQRRPHSGGFSHRQSPSPSLYQTTNSDFDY